MQKYFKKVPIKTNLGMEIFLIAWFIDRLSIRFEVKNSATQFISDPKTSISKKFNENQN